MSLHETVRWAVTYDIADRRRGSKVHRFLKRHGLPLQYSVFLVEASAAQMQQLMVDLKELIAWHLDDVRAYRWPAQAECQCLGREMVAEQTLLGAGAVPAHRKKAELLGA